MRHADEIDDLRFDLHGLGRLIDTSSTKGDPATPTSKRVPPSSESAGTALEQLEAVGRPA